MSPQKCGRYGNWATDHAHLKDRALPNDVTSNDTPILSIKGGKTVLPARSLIFNSAIIYKYASEFKGDISDMKNNGCIDQFTSNELTYLMATPDETAMIPLSHGKLIEIGDPYITIGYMN